MAVFPGEVVTHIEFSEPLLAESLHARAVGAKFFREFVATL